MSDITNIFLKKFLLALCQALELLNRRIFLHQQRVTIISLNLANRMQLASSEKTTLFYAALLHDIGLFLTRDDKIEILDFDCQNVQNHCELACDILKRIELLKDIAEPIRYHHHHWANDKQGDKVKQNLPILSQIIHLADRTEVLIKENIPIIQQSEEIISRIMQYKGSWFNPEIAEHFKEITKEKVFWLSVASEFTKDIVNEFAPTDDRKIVFDNMIELSSLFAQIVDYKSQHTKNHSVQVTALSLKIAMFLHWQKPELKKLWASALLHDLGKLSIQDEILDKTAALTANEYTIMKMHPYFGYLILSTIPGFEEIAQWSLYHHEYLDGRGYPFGVQGDNIPEGARIIAVADKYTALTEDRPYRRSLSAEEAFKILEDDAKQNRIDRKILNVLKTIIQKGQIPYIKRG
jgi:HD-GYP domain-containing protein (c-di-GMP phosphodiesterase class II)